MDGRTESCASPVIALAIGIPTFRRPESLTKLLSVLGERAAELPGNFEVTALVVDNDPDGTARGVVAQNQWGVDVRYAHEPRPGIAAARSRLLAEASDHQLLVFIDDDEWPLPGWLPELVRMWEETGATAVMGSVETVLPEAVDPWVLAFGIFDRAERAPGQRLPAAATGNLLLDLDQVRTLGVDFDPRLGMRGGEDTLFTRTLVLRGGTIVACPTSVARDEPGAMRATREFTLRRARSHGTTQADIDLRLAPNGWRRLISRLRSTGKGGVWVAVAAARGTRGVLQGRLSDRAWSARHFQRGVGLLHGAWGTPPGEYARGGDASEGPGRKDLSTRVRSVAPVFRSIVGVTTDEPVVVLTLDDGPDPHWTPVILDLLRDRGASATFFVLLSRTRQHPELLARIVAEGHEVGLHGVDHRRATALSVRDLAEQLLMGRRELEVAVGAPIRWYRPPYGAMTPRRWGAVQRLGLQQVLWSTSALDGRDATRAERMERASRIGPGSILLAHDSRAGISDGADDPAIEEFDRAGLIADILDVYASRGLRAVSLGRALGSGTARRAMML
ncbi:polysaccharide deacetylase family protein [Tessaracoccus sp.]